MNGIFGNNFSTNGTGRSAAAENGKEMNSTICESFSNAAKSLGTNKHGSRCFAWTTGLVNVEIKLVVTFTVGCKEVC